MRFSFTTEHVKSHQLFIWQHQSNFLCQGSCRIPIQKCVGVFFRAHILFSFSLSGESFPSSSSNFQVSIEFRGLLLLTSRPEAADEDNGDSDVRDTRGDRGSRRRDGRRNGRSPRRPHGQFAGRRQSPGLFVQAGNPEVASASGVQTSNRTRSVRTH